MSYFTITVEVDEHIKTEGFYLEGETELIMDDMAMMSVIYLGSDLQEFEDGTIGFFSSNGNSIYIQKHDVEQLKFL